MGLTSEQVHWIFGGAISLVTTFLLAREGGIFRGDWLRYALPLGLLGLAAETFLDPLIHGRTTPQHGAAETAQHYVMGALIGAVAIVEFLRVRRRLQARSWGFLLPAGLGAVGIVFLAHSQHDSGAPAILLLAQHRVMGVTLLVAAAAKFFAELRHEKSRSFEVGWLVAILIFGLELLLYTEAGPSSVHTGH